MNTLIKETAVSILNSRRINKAYGLYMGVATRVALSNTYTSAVRKVYHHLAEGDARKEKAMCDTYDICVSYAKGISGAHRPLRYALEMFANVDLLHDKL